MAIKRITLESLKAKITDRVYGLPEDQITESEWKIIKKYPHHFENDNGYIKIIPEYLRDRTMKRNPYKISASDFTKITNDTNGNPRYVLHFLAMDSDYNKALKKARALGGKKFHNKQYGGGIVFSTYNLDSLVDRINAVPNISPELRDAMRAERERLEDDARKLESVENPKGVAMPAIRAFLQQKAGGSGNTKSYGTVLRLFDNAIAKWDGDDLYISHQGYPTVTTKDRLNGLPNVNIVQRQGQWYLNGNLWNGDWIKVYTRNGEVSNGLFSGIKNMTRENFPMFQSWLRDNYGLSVAELLTAGTNNVNSYARQFYATALAKNPRHTSNRKILQDLAKRHDVSQRVIKAALILEERGRYQKPFQHYVNRVLEDEAYDRAQDRDFEKRLRGNPHSDKIPVTVQRYADKHGFSVTKGNDGYFRIYDQVARPYVLQEGLPVQYTETNERIDNGAVRTADQANNLMRSRVWQYRQYAKTASKRNPASNPDEAFNDQKIDELSATFQGRISGDELETLGSDYTPQTTARLGRLVLMKVKLADGGIADITFDGDAWLSADARKNLYISGKKSRITNVKKPRKGSLTHIGELEQINYVTTKEHIEDGNLVEYYHPLGEVDGVKPHVFIDKDGFPIIVGGNYDIGINGIEN